MRTTHYTLSRRDKVLGVIAAILILGILLYGLYNNYAIKRNPVYYKAVITKFYYGAKNKATIRYEFYIHNEKYGGDEIYRRHASENIEIGDTCQIVYEKDNPVNNSLVKNDNDRMIVAKRN